MLKDEGRCISLSIDECDQGVGEPCKLISTPSTLSDKVRCWVSSRPEVDVPPTWKNPHISRITIDLDGQSSERPVNAYIDHSFPPEAEGHDADTLAVISIKIRLASHEHVSLGLVSLNELDPVEDGML